MDDWKPEASSAYARLLNPKWKDYQPDLPAGDPAVDAMLFDMLENLLVRGSIKLERTFLSNTHSWQISYKLESDKGLMTGGGGSVRDALGALAINMAQARLK